MMEPDSISVEVPHGVLFMHDPTFWDFPEPLDDGAVWGSPQGITIGCLHQFEGPTDISMGPASAVGRTDHLKYDDELETPTGNVRVMVVPGDVVLERQVPNTKTRVRIWTDGHRSTGMQGLINFLRSRGGSRAPKRYDDDYCHDRWEMEHERCIQFDDLGGTDRYKRHARREPPIAGPNASETEDGLRPTNHPNTTGVTLCQIH